MIEAVGTPYQGFALLCRKCSKKLDGGFGPKGDEKLGRVLKKGLREAGRRRALRVVEVGCFGLCPKKAVTVASSAVPGTLLVVPRGAPVDEVIGAVLGHPARTAD